MISTSKDLLINWKQTPAENSQEFESFWEEERQKCKNGITIDGIFINPFLYWHCNLWTIISDHITKGRIRQKPDFRDSEWLITNKIWEAETWKDEYGNIRKKGVIAAGTRRFSKSEIEASFCAWKACNWRNSQVLVSGLNEPDIKIITDKIDLGINELPNYWVKSKVEDNWKKQVSLGHKDAKTGERNIYSSFAIRNFDGGTNEEALAGLTPSGGVIDEGGKGSFLKALLAGLPGLSTPSGWRGTFLVMGTGGDMENFKDFQTLFDDPEQYNFLSCEIPDENRRGGLFLPGHMSYAYPKIQSNLADHINVDPKKYPNLAKIKIVVSDKEVNNATIDKERVEKSKSQDPSALLKHMMYFPKNSREMFMSVSNNNFPLKAAENHQLWLRDGNFEPEYVDLYRDEGNRVQSKYSELRPISKYPVNATDFKEAPIVLYERPQDLPYGSYCMGVDAYNKNDSSDKVNSLGSVYIFKRMYDPLGEFQNSIVASYSGRPAEITTFYQIALNLCEYYGAICLPETNERFIDFFVNKKKGNLIHDSVQLARDINPLTSIRAPKGLNPSVTNQKYYMELEVQYTTEELEHGDGNKIGIVRILDPMLLEEMIQYRSKAARTGGVHDINCDRIVAFGHCLVLAQHMDKYAPLDSWKPKDKEQVFRQDPTIKSFFGTLHKKTTGPFKSISDIPVRPKNNGMRFI